MNEILFMAFTCITTKLVTDLWSKLFDKTHGDSINRAWFFFFVFKVETSKYVEMHELQDHFKN